MRGVVCDGRINTPSRSENNISLICVNMCREYSQLLKACSACRCDNHQDGSYPGEWCGGEGMIALRAQNRHTIRRKHKRVHSSNTHTRAHPSTCTRKRQGTNTAGGKRSPSSQRACAAGTQPLPWPPARTPVTAWRDSPFPSASLHVTGDAAERDTQSIRKPCLTVQHQPERGELPHRGAAAARHGAAVCTQACQETRAHVQHARQQPGTALLSAHMPAWRPHVSHRGVPGDPGTRTTHNAAQGQRCCLHTDVPGESGARTTRHAWKFEQTYNTPSKSPEQRFRPQTGVPGDHRTRIPLL
ncbi:hypothetical protein NDU88_003489 [Pleurodeles waltl]|uniref:Uncharacterized protein n=1 Tax=Pleurodeles waltl TaxID=8319 RepID=A0AAV7NLL0_PLEWA|nr:hypothetical protein NDU88_003489 [Pleurodeles waltl]